MIDLNKFKKENDCLITPSGLTIRSKQDGGLYVDKRDLCSNQKFKDQAKQLSLVAQKIKRSK